MIRLSRRDFNLSVMDDHNSNPSITIIAQPETSGNWNISVQPHGNQSFRQDETAHNKIKCFLSFLTSSGFTHESEGMYKMNHTYGKHVDSHEDVMNTCGEINTFLKKNKLIFQ